MIYGTQIIVPYENERVFMRSWMGTLFRKEVRNWLKSQGLSEVRSVNDFIWCKKSCWYIKHDNGKRYTEDNSLAIEISRVSIYFNREDDATLFKLAWCGSNTQDIIK